jgi:methionyl-tRNA formyltransferase
VLDLPRSGCINVHASLLPRWRGAAPIQAAILHGDAETGVTIMRMDPGVDTGGVLSQRSTPIYPADTAATLSERLSRMGAELLMETLPDFLDGTLSPRPQDETLATRAPMLKKEDGQLDFSQPAALLARQVRAYNPWPGVFFTWQAQPLKILQAHAANGAKAAPGTPTVDRGLPAVGTAEGLLVLDEVQPAGKKAMGGQVFLRGARGWGAA